MQNVKKGISIILPAFNEELNIEKVINDVYDYLSKNITIAWEIIVVNDGSIDKTKSLVEKLTLKIPNLYLINFETNRGYGCAIYEGIKKSKFSYIFFTDADGQFDIKNLDVLLKLMDTGIPDMVIGYRLNRKDSFVRKILSTGYNILADFLFDLNVKDVDCAFKIFKREVFDKIKIETTGFCFNTEVLAKARMYNMNIVEVGVPHFKRYAGKSKVTFAYIPYTLKEVLKIWWRLRKK